MDELKGAPEDCGAGVPPVAFAGVELLSPVGDAAMLWAVTASPPFGAAVASVTRKAGDSFGSAFEMGGIADGCTSYAAAAAFGASVPPLAGASVVCPGLKALAINAALSSPRGAVYRMLPVVQHW